MSTTIDERVVEMRFDNKHFENNVQTTMSTLEKFKQSLNLTGASKGLENVNTAASKVNMSGLGGAVETVTAKFSALQVMGVTALANITNSAVNAGKRIASALTIEPIKTGFSEYETQINAVQTILANTKSKGTTIDDVNGALDELNTYADKTIYNFTEMTRNIGTFTAAGVDLDKSVTSIKGIANLAAVSGSSSQQASTAMYQLSQALAAGKVSLMDWNSVVNAGMGGQVFQDALKRTATNMGHNVDAMIEKYGSFRESLTKGEWLTADVLTETLTQLSGAYSKADLIAQGYTEKQATEILELAGTAEEAATKVKTFTQLWDTLKEAAQSGWTQSWEIIVGDFEEAKETLTKVSDVIGGMIGESAKARNDLLQGWKDAGGRTDLVEGFSNAFDGIMNVVKPISEAFRDIFPPLTVKQLVGFTEGFKNLTASFAEFTSKHGDDIKSTFKGIFSILDIGVTFIKDLIGGVVDLIGNFSGLGGGILEATGSLGDWLSNLRDSVKETDIFGTAIDKITGFLGNIITKIKEFGSSVKQNVDASAFDGLAGLFQGIWNFIVSLGSKIGDVISYVSEGIVNTFGGEDLFDVLNSGLFAGILVGIQQLVKGLNDPIKAIGDMFEQITGEDGVLENVTGILDDVRGCFQAYQDQLKAGTLFKIASAIGILAAAIWLVSTIDADALDRSLGAITVLFVELMASLSAFTKISASIAGVAKSCGAMISMSIAIAILAVALKTMSSVDADGIARGLVAIGVLMAEISAFLQFTKFDGKLTGTAVGIVILSTAMLVLAKAVKSFGSMKWDEIGKGLLAIAALLTEITLFTRFTGNASNVISTGVAMILLGAAMKIFASAVKDFSGMKWDEIGRGLSAMGGALAEVVLAMKFMPKNAMSVGAGLVIVATAMKILASALSDFGGMSWSEIGKGLTAMGGALAELAIGLNFMNGTLAGSAALLIAAASLSIIAPVLTTLGGLSWTAIGKGLVAIAGAFAVVGVAGLLLGPLVPTLLGLSAAFVLFGAATLGIGAGLALIGAGLTLISGGIAALGTSLSAAATAIVAALAVIIVGIVNLIPTVISKLGDAILALCSVIADCVPAIADTILLVIVEVLNALVEYTPQIVDSLLKFVIDILQSLADNLPALIKVAVDVIGAFFQGVVDALSGIDVSSLLKGIVGVGLLAGLMYALSLVVGLVPSAMAGVLGMGLVIAELALVLAAIGALAQIPGLQWLIDEGGDFLQSIGTAIGQFIGGIIGGIAAGVTSTFPQIGKDLSDFMTNIEPFINGAKNIDPSMMEGVQSLADAILTITKAEILSIFTGENSMSEFVSELVTFGEGVKAYSDAVAGIDPEVVTASATAAQALTELANNIPNSGGLAGIFAGENDIDSFGSKLVPFGEAMKEYSDAVVGINTDAISNSVTAAGALVDLSENLPNSGGLASLFTGDNDISDFGSKLVPFGEGLKKYSDSVIGVDVDAVSNSATAAGALVDISNTIPNSGGLASLFSGDNNIDSFGSKLVPFGKAMKEYSDAVIGLDTGAVSDSVTAAGKMVTLINKISSVDTSGVDNFKNAISTLGKTDMNSVVNAFSASASKLSTVGSKMTDSLVKGMKSKQSSLNVTAMNLVTSMLAPINSKTTLFVRSGTLIMMSLVKGITSQKSKIKAAMSSTVSESISSIRGYYMRFYTAGSYLVDGFASGISANTWKAEAKAKAMANAAEKAAKEALDINSPSKVFRALGYSVPEGFAMGIDRMSSMVAKSSVSMTDMAVANVSKSVSRIAEAINTDIDAQPTIRPVVDLSDVSSGVNAINGMLSMNPSVGVMSNIRAINGMMAERQNGNVEVVSAINKLRKELGNVGNTTYSINGITYDDGSNIADAVQSLVRAARVERRV